MGQTVTAIVKKSDDLHIAAGIDIMAEEGGDFPVYRSVEECRKAGIKADVLIDFSSPAVLTELLSYGIETGTALVLCTTGYTKEQTEEIKKASEKTAILRSANMSVGINILASVLKDVSAKLAEAGFDIEIVEKHHNLKKDAPSGTALLLGDAINEALPDHYEYVYDRSGRNEKRPVREIGFSAVRAGTIPGDHDVIFGGEDEVITFSHRAYSKAVFAKGAVQAAGFLKGKKPGLYSMSDVIG